MAIAFLSISNSHAVDWSGPNEVELKSLPPYCQAKYDQNSPDKKKWEQSLGLTFQRIRHYCSALNFINRYHTASKKERASLLSFALNEFGYMVQHSEPDSPLLQEIYLNRAGALRYANKESNAIKDYQKAIELGPKVARGHVELARLYASKSMRDKALDVASQGLRHIPDNVTLQNLYTKYGGKLPFPEPLIKKEKNSSEPALPDPTINEEPKARRDSNQNDLPGALTTPSIPTTNTHAVNSPENLDNAIEKKWQHKNPWCRFCPE
jgi:tetratricopeptide (TPR) repeat protein